MDRIISFLRPLNHSLMSSLPTNDIQVSSYFLLSWNFSFLCIVGFVLVYFYRWCIRPYNYIRPLGSVQFSYVQDQLNKPGMKNLTRGRRIGEFPPPYPNGWFVIEYSRNLKPGEVKLINALGRQFALWRDSKKEVHLFDAYCPHLGANLGFGGTVENDCLRCPFHGWSFSGDGKVASVAYTKDCKGPDFVKMKTFYTHESNECIYYYHHAEDKEPDWYPPSFPEINEKFYSFHGTTEHHICAHIQELPENGADVAHLNPLHGVFIIPQLSPLFGHLWEVSWKPMEGEKKYITEIELHEHVTIAGKVLDFLDVNVKINQVGPGFVWLHFDTPFGKALVCESVTPIGPMLQQSRHIIWSEWTVIRPIAKFILFGLVAQYEKDLPIWQWKTFPSQPLLLKEDSNIPKFRRWFSQFYSPSSKSFEQAVKEYSKAKEVIPDW